jgi:hypothetical protein
MSICGDAAFAEFPICPEFPGADPEMRSTEATPLLTFGLSGDPVYEMGHEISYRLIIKWN